jgi:hypothetical protein
LDSPTTARVYGSCRKSFALSIRAIGVGTCRQSFWYKLSYYGANLDPKASVQVEPFMPPVFGYKLVGQFDVWSYPTWGSYLFFSYGLLLVAAVWLTWRDAQKVTDD